jgi:hypothetical protein
VLACPYTKYTIIWRLGIKYYPQQDILLHTHVVHAAFRRILYASSMAIIFTYVFGPYVIIPAGMVFGAPSVPSFFSIASDIRADIATTGDLHLNQSLHLLTQNVKLPELTNPQDLTPAMPDAQNLPLSLIKQENFNNYSFVDDNGICAILAPIIPALQQSLLLAFVLFGRPSNDRRGSCVRPDKWDPLVSFIVLFLGYKISSHTLLVTWA